MYEWISINIRKLSISCKNLTKNVQSLIMSYIHFYQTFSILLIKFFSLFFLLCSHFNVLFLNFFFYNNNKYPVWRSPMINSRWPRPIGTRESTALMPVCMGSLTEIRGMMPGALMPTRNLCLVLMGPLPSIALPKHIFQQNAKRFTNPSYLKHQLHGPKFRHQQAHLR